MIQFLPNSIPDIYSGKITSHQAPERDLPENSFLSNVNIQTVNSSLYISFDLTTVSNSQFDLTQCNYMVVASGILIQNLDSNTFIPVQHSNTPKFSQNCQTIIQATTTTTSTSTSTSTTTASTPNSSKNDRIQNYQIYTIY